MKKNIIILSFILFFFGQFTALFAQPTIAWDKRYDCHADGSVDINGGDIKQTSDGGYIIATTVSGDAGNDLTESDRGFSDYWIIKISSNGTKEWDKRFGGDADDYLTSIQELSGGGYILAGYSYSGATSDKTDGSQGGSDYWIIKTDASGNKVWDKRFGGDADETLWSVQELSGGGFILGGYSASGATGDKTQASQGSSDYWIVKIDASGNYVWDKRFGGSGADIFRSLQQTSDGGFILAGYSASGATGDRTDASQGADDFWIVKTDGSGTKSWDKRFGGSSTDKCYAIKQTTDGGYILGGQSNSTNNGDKSEGTQGLYDYWIVKTDGSGTKSWDKRFGGTSNEYIRSISQLSDGGYLLGGYSMSGLNGDKSEASQGVWDYWIIRTNSSGTKTWDKRFGGDGVETLNAFTNTTDGAFVLAGTSWSSLSGDVSANYLSVPDLWIVKTSYIDALPIELLSFTAKPIDKKYVLTEWTTASEINNDYFTVEKTKDARQYESVGRVKGTGNSSGKLSYQLIDSYPYQGTSYYRLKQTDFDGKFTHSDLVPVNLSGIDIISISPNPAINNFEYKIGSTEKMSVQVKAIDILGQIVINKTENIEKGITQKRLNVSALSSGTYILQIITENKETCEKQFQVK